MIGEQNKLIELFAKYGWELVEARRMDDRWFVEMWLIKSIWSPTDCFVFFTFETDPQLEKPIGKPTAYNIVANLRKPIDWMAETESQFKKNEIFDDFAVLYLGKNFEKKTPDFFKDLNDLRLKFNNLSI